LRSDLAVHVESWVAPGEDFLDKGKADELFPKQQGEDLMGEDFAEALIMEAGDMVEGAIWGCAPLGCQDMDVGMEIDAISKSLDHRHHSWHELMACDGVKIFQEGMDCCQRQWRKEGSLVPEEQPKHLRYGKDNLAVRDIEKKLLPHPLAPLLTALGMAGRTETTGFAGKHEEMLLPTVGTPDAGKPTHRIATVEITVHHLLDNGPKVPVVTLKTRFIFQKKTLKIMEKHPVENAALWMTLTVYPCHSTRTLVH
jgi:hypothetical protein